MCILSCMAWILFGANRTPPFIPWSKKSALSVIQFVVSCRLTFRIFRFECDFICDVFICSASHLPLPSHTTHSVAQRSSYQDPSCAWVCSLNPMHRTHEGHSRRHAAGWLYATSGSANSRATGQPPLRPQVTNSFIFAWR